MNNWRLPANANINPRLKRPKSNGFPPLQRLYPRPIRIQTTPIPRNCIPASLDFVPFLNLYVAKPRTARTTIATIIHKSENSKFKLAPPKKCRSSDPISLPGNDKRILYNEFARAMCLVPSNKPNQVSQDVDNGEFAKISRIRVWTIYAARNRLFSRLRRELADLIE